MVTFGYTVGLDGKKISSRIGASVGDSVAKFATTTHLSILVTGFWLVKESFGLSVGLKSTNIVGSATG